MGPFLRFVLLAAVILFIGAFFSIEIASPAQKMSNCQKIAGQWHMTYSGTSCAQENEEGVLVLDITPDCAFRLKRQSTFPFFSEMEGSEKSLQYKNGHIKASVSIPFDYCSNVTLEGTIKKTPKGPQITGTYRYNAKGGGHFKGVLKKNQ